MDSSTGRKNVVLFDGKCAFCQKQIQRLLRMARKGALEPVDFQTPGALDAYPAVTYDACMEAMHLVTPDGKIYRGFEAAVHAVATRPVIGKLAYIYYLPGLRWLCDRFYAWLAARRYRLAAAQCTNGTCALHAPGSSNPVRERTTA
jgi:predicted DCC family thiol-disulfide oxidoreductase YuxK